MNWIQVTPSELVPGDFVSIATRTNPSNLYQQDQSKTHHNSIPADILLVHGNAVVDEALLTGESIPQLKNPLDNSATAPSPLTPTTKTETETRLDIQDPQHKESILFGGTVLLSHDSKQLIDMEDDDDIQRQQQQQKSSLWCHPPDGGIVGIVIRTGFETAQGNLLRTIAHATVQGDGIHTMDTFVFIFILLCCAIVSALLVLFDGWYDETRNRFRLLLHVIIIITSVVPPELPMELSLAVTNSVADLMKRCQVFCTEHFRIPLAGQVNVCCFDKTGTLTSDQMRLKGVRVLLIDNTNQISNDHRDKETDTSKQEQHKFDPDLEENALIHPSSFSSDNHHDHDDDDDHDHDHEHTKQPPPLIPWPVVRIMAACHSLALIYNPTGKQQRQRQYQIIGDPLEKAILKDTGYQLESNNTLVKKTNKRETTTTTTTTTTITTNNDSTTGKHQQKQEPQQEQRPNSVTILHRFAFSSRLKRMTVLTCEDTIGTSTTNTIQALTKGAPETIKQLLDPLSIPVDYDQIAMYHMSRGRRVLAMGYRNLSIDDLSKKKNNKTTNKNLPISHRFHALQRQQPMDRNHIEQHFIFAGFLILDCPLKTDSKSIIVEMINSGHKVVMITGDAVLTAAEVAKQVGILPTTNKTKKKTSKTKTKTPKTKTTKIATKTNKTTKTTTTSATTATTTTTVQKDDDDTSSVLTKYILKEQPQPSPPPPQQQQQQTLGMKDKSPSSLSTTRKVLQNFMFVPLTATIDDSDKSNNTATLSCTNLKDLQKLWKDEKASFCITGDILAKVAYTAVRQQKQQQKQQTSKKDSKNYQHVQELLPEGQQQEQREQQQQNAIHTSTNSQDDEKHILLHPSAQAVLKELVTVISVFARHAPHQKEAVIAAFNSSGYHTLMCGDGTNDMGALKRAHVGISIISAPDVEATQRKANKTLSKIKSNDRKQQKKEKKLKKMSKSTKTTTKKASTTTTSYYDRKSKLEQSLRQLQEAQEQLDHVELGDASIASPFTSRAVSIKCCKDVLQQGRCTLVTMMTIYKILGINCLVNAMVLSQLFLHGVKQGDRQLTMMGMVIAALFLFVTRGKPLPNTTPLSSIRPPSSVLCPAAMLSIAIQFAIHYATILLGTTLALGYVDPYDPSIQIPDGPFNPNALNTVTFLCTFVSTITTFAVNYRGQPFMEDLIHNTLLFRTVLLSYAVVAICVLEIFTPLNDLFQLSELPTGSSSSSGDDGMGGIGGIGGIVASNATTSDDDDDYQLFFYQIIHEYWIHPFGFPSFLGMILIVDTCLTFSSERILLWIFQ